MNRRTLIAAVAAGAALPLLNRVAIAQTSPKTKNVVFVHGLFADGSCWSKVIARLQQKSVNCTSVQNPLTSLHEASEAARRAIATQPGPTVLVGHSFSRMIVSEVRVDPKITALVYVAARHPMPARTIRRWRRPIHAPGHSRHCLQRRLEPVIGELSCTTSRATCRRRRRASSTRFSSRSRNRSRRKRPRMPPGAPSRPSMPCPPRTGRSIPTWSASWPSEWVRTRSRSRQAT